MSSSDDFEEDSVDDFSASEDEWKPSKKDASTSEEEEVEDDDEDEGTSRGTKRKRPAKGKINTSAAKRKVPSLRSKMFRKYKPIPKTVKSPPGPPRIIPGTIQQILEQSRYQKGKKVVDPDDSGSSGDEHLVPASELDLESNFFKAKPKEDTPPPNFDCNVGMRLSDSDEEDENPAEEDTKIMSKIVSRINQTSSNSMDFRKLEDFTENIPKIKVADDTATKNHENLDISSLLAMGESTGVTKKSQKASKSRKRPAGRDSESDWEEVEEFQRRTKKEVDLEACIKRKLNRQIKENQIYLHKVSILCFLATGNHMNSVLCKGKLLDAAVKLLPSKNSYPRKNGADSQYFQHMTSWFRGAVKLEDPKMYGKLNTMKLQEQLDEEIKNRQTSCFRNFTLIFLLLLRGMAIDSRLILNFTGHPIRPHPSQLCRITMKPKEEKEEKPGKPSKNAKKPKIEEKNPRPGSSKSSSIPNGLAKKNQTKENPAKGSKVNLEKLKSQKKPEENPPIVLRSRQAKIVARKPSENTPEKSPEKIFQEDTSPVRKTRSQTRNQTSQAPNLSKLKKTKTTKNSASEPPVKAIEIETTPQPSTSRQTPKKPDSRLFAPEAVIPRQIKPKPIDHRVFSSDSDDWTREKKRKEDKIDIWVEVYSDKEQKWLAIDLFNGKVDKIEKIIQTAFQPISYVFAWHADKTVKDVSPRYCPQWNTTTRKYRIDKEWLDDTLQPFLGKKTKRDREEDRELDKIHLDKPLPKTITEYKDHPLYALERHLLKYQALYPPNPPPLGYVRNEAVYARECVHTLHTREHWLKEARVYSNTMLKDIPLEIFGIWQTSPYVPPVAKNGIVPRNEYGNVELFKDCMLPKNTVHIQLPGINKICKRLNIDCAPAIVGFDFHSGWCHPTIDGFVICKEFEDKVLDEWNREQDEAERKEDEKREKRVYGNWRKLIKGLLIRARLQAKYNFKDEEGS
uniref:Rad4 beta-hairpin domain-containing protein n=1 Tax=Phlebotomus papatasi TaxID=29031 RepID=A0A1B0DMG8_PHLPP